MNISAREGQYKPWWNTIQITLFGWNSTDALTSLQGAPSTTGGQVDREHHSVMIEIPDNEKGENVEFNARN